GDRGDDVGDAAHLVGQVVGHLVDVVGRVLPGAADARNLRLPAELALGADLARHAGYFAGERVQLVYHRVDGVLELEDLALHVDGDLAREIAAGDRRGDVGDVADLAGQVVGHQIDVVGQVLPGTRDAGHLRLDTRLPFGADLSGHTGDFRGERVELVDHRVDGVLQLENLALHVDRDLLRQVAERDRGGHLGDVADLAGQVGGHCVDVVGQILPGAGDALDLRLSAKPALGTDLAGDTGHFRGERVELVDHRVDGVLELEDLALHVDRDLLRQVAASDG